MRNILVEMYVNSAWTDITSDYYQRDAITITRGKSDEAGQAAPSSCTLTLNNRLGKYSPRNPMGALYGQIGRNTPIRVSVDPEKALKVTDTSATLSTPDSVGLSVTGDIDLRVDVRPDTTWRAGSFISKYGVAGNRSWYFNIGPTGRLEFVWSPDGTATITATSTAAVPFAVEQRGAVRVTLAVNNGAAGNTVTFYTSDTMAGTWTQLGAAVVTAGTTSIFDSTAAVDLGESPNNPEFTLPGLWYKAEIRNGIGGPVVGNPDMTAPAIGATSFVDGAGNSWTLSSGMSITPAGVRFRGEVSSFPARWDTSGKDAYVPIECAGLLRRLGQGVASPASGLQEAILAGNPHAYWPLTGAAGTRYSIDLGRSPATRFYPVPDGPGGPSFKYGEPLGNLGTGIAVFNTLGGLLRGDVGVTGATVAIDFVFQTPDLGRLSLDVYDYSGNIWTLTLTGGTAQVSLYEAGVITDFPVSAVLPELSDQQVHHVRLGLTQSGANTVWTLYVDGVSVSTGTKTSFNVDGCTTVNFFYDRTTHSWVVLGHVVGWLATAPTAAFLTNVMRGRPGEVAGARIERLMTAAGYGITTVGTAADTTPMGAQHTENLLATLRDAETTDMGILTEPRDRFGLLYRTRKSHYNQSAKLTLNYGSGHLAPPLEPVDDDRGTRNDVTAVRRDGDSYRVTQETGAMSALEPPAGIGRYKDEYTANVQTDNQLPDIAGWLLHMGTVDEARYPSVRVNLAAPAAAAIVAAALSVDIGDRIVITNAAPINLFDAVSLIALGYVERLNPFEHVITFNCAPGSPYEVIRLDNPTSRISSGEASSLTSSLTTTATAVSVTSTAGTLWTTAAADMPISLMIAGEEMTVTAITGATSPQTFTVTRSVNGVTKTHAAGEIVRLKRRAVWAL